MDDELIAHVCMNENGTWAPPHMLKEHLLNTAKLAELYAEKFNSGKWGKAAGLAHDAGKGRRIWQDYLKQKSGYDDEAHLEGKKGKIPHAIHGAILVESVFGKGIGRIWPIVYLDIMLVCQIGLVLARQENPRYSFKNAS